MAGRMRVEVAGSFVLSTCGVFALAVVLMSVLFGRRDAGTFAAALGVVAIQVSAVYLHELGHALVARSDGTPVRCIRLTALGGAAVLARPCASPRDQLRLALAGPLVNLAIFLAAAMVAGSAFGWDLREVTIGLVSPTLPGVAELLVFWALGINAYALLLNLMPGVPLDGGRAVQAALWQITRDPWLGWYVAAVLGVAVGVGLGIAGLAALSELGDPVLASMAAVVGATILLPAWKACDEFDAYRRLQSTEVGDRLSPPLATLRTGATIDDAHRSVFRRHPDECHFPLLDADDRFLGLVHRPQVAEALARGHGARSVEEVLSPPEKDPVLVACAPDATVGSLLATRFLADHYEITAVAADGRLCGISAWEAVRRVDGRLVGRR